MALADEGTTIAMELLIDALSARSPVVRKAAAESLAQYESEQGVQALALALNDPNELVRIAAAESLGVIGDQKAVPSLLQALSDRSALCRGWIVNALGDIKQRRSDVLPALRAMLNVERNSFVKLNIWRALYIFGHDDALPEVISFLKSKSYRIRCATSNALAEIVDQTNCEIIEKSLRKALSKEKTIASRGSMERVLSLCETYHV